MSKFFGVVVLAFALALPTAVGAAEATAAQKAAKKQALEALATPQAATSTSVTCTLCFSCGGKWPVIAGAFITGSPVRTTEHGSSCAGPLATNTSDNQPFLCCRKLP